ncbi:Piwi domain-containing protein [Coprinopsis sp. MPI-PUGE-AT-0042]|nr:Piwi domain-containing protein [Coprinopsis sp. MPI-PUGE-AT-0042]
MSQIPYQPVVVTTNAFEVTSLPRDPYLQYDVSFEPDFRGAAFRKKRELVNHLQTRVAPEDFTSYFLFDGGAVGYARSDLAIKLGPTKTYYTDLRSEKLFDPSRWKESRSPCVKITLTMTAGMAIQPQEIQGIVSNINGADPQRRELLTTFLQLVLRQGTNNQYPNNGKAYFTASSASGHSDGQPAPNAQYDGRGDSGWGGRGRGRGRGGPPARGGPPGRGGGGGGQADMFKVMRNGLELRRGIHHSMRPALGKMIVTIDTTAVAFFSPGPLMDLIGRLLGERNMGTLAENSPNFHKMVKLVKGVQIKVSKPEKQKDITKTIKGFVPSGGLLRFESPSGPITVEQHYLAAHGYRLVYPRAPGVVLRREPNLCVVPMELCTVLQNQIFKKKLPDDCINDMVSFASINPSARFAKIQEATANYASNETMRQAGMQVETKPVEVTGKMYQPPQLSFGGSTLQPDQGKWNVQNKKFWKPRALEFYAILNCNPTGIGAQVVNALVNEIQRCGASLGMAPRPPVTVNAWVQGSPIESLNATMKEVFRIMKVDVGDKEKLRQLLRQFVLFVILPQEAAAIRSAVKYWGDVLQGVTTQCVRSGKIQRVNNQYVNNLLLKINARLGGINSIVESVYTLRGLHLDEKTMIFGADVGHAGPGVRNKPSVTSVVYSVDRHGTRYEAVTSIQRPRLETIEGLRKSVGDALPRFARMVNGPPDNIIFFRDGVSEGEYSRVATQEIAAIREGIQDFVTAYAHMQVKMPKLTFIVVGKRHHTLLFPPRGSVIDDGKGNCKAGIAVDSGITQPWVENFYLQTHAAIQGTSRSAHYIVLEDEVFQRFEARRLEAMQEYSFALCHLYAKATRSVSIPAPVYYSDLACGRGAFHFDPHNQSLQLDDNSSNSSSDSKEYNADIWNAAFKPVHRGLAPAMYFL